MSRWDKKLGRPAKLVDVVRALRAWWPRAVATLGPVSGRGCRYAEISFRLVWTWNGEEWRLSLITREESRGES